MKKGAEGERANGARLGAILPLAALVCLWGYFFSPVLFRGENLLGYRLLDPRYTGLDPALARRSLFNRLPSQDASLLLTHYPYQDYLAENFHRGRFPLWNPWIGCGVPVASDPQYKPLNPFFWPFYVKPSGWLFSLGIALMALCGLTGWFLFLRDLRLSGPAAVIGSALMVFNPLTQQTIVLSSSWVAWVAPWGLLAAEAWHRKRPWALTAIAALVGLMLLVGHPLIALLYAVLVAAYLAFGSSDRKPSDRWRAVAASAALAMILTAVHILPLVANLGTYWSYKSHWDGGPYCHWVSLINPKSEIYVPMPFWGLALVGFLHGADRRLRLYFTGVLVYGVLVMFPWVQGPLRWVLTFGGLLVARYGEEAFWLGLLGLVTGGMDALAHQASRSERLAQGRALLYGVVWYYGLCWLSVLTDSLFWPQVYRKLARMEILAFLTLSMIVALPLRRRWREPATGLLAVLLLIPPKMPLSMSRYFSNVDLSADPPAVVKAMKQGDAAGGYPRIWGAYYPLELLADLCPNQNLVWELSDIRITSPLLLDRYKRFADHWNRTDLFGTYCFFPRLEADALRFLGVEWVVADRGSPREGLSIVQSLGPLVLQQVSEPVPWVRPAGRWETASGEEDLWRKTFASLRSGSWRHTAVLEREPPVTPPEGDFEAPAITWLERGPDRWRWRVEGPDACVLQVVMNHHPNWRAFVDGQPAPVLRAFGAFMAVAVPAGTHTVELVYREPWFWVGLGVSAAGWLAVAAWLAFGWRRRAGGSACGGNR